MFTGSYQLAKNVNHNKSFLFSLSKLDYKMDHLLFKEEL